jgi:PTH1 family peptidyl-tRNA hydrolase
VKLIVGIGNPGRSYARSRHNVGWMVLDVLAARYEFGAARDRFEGLAAEGRIGEAPALLLKPTTYVNESGRSVAKAVAWHDAALADLLVCCDDINLPLGQVRVRRKGSSGGHGGLASCIARLATEEFARLRVGVGRGEGESQVGHVLGPFAPAEKPVIEAVIERAADAVVTWVRDGIEACMNAYN